MEDKGLFIQNVEDTTCVECYYFSGKTAVGRIDCFDYGHNRVHYRV